MHSFIHSYLFWPASFWRCCLFPSVNFWILYQKVSISVWIFVLDFNIITLINMSMFVPIPWKVWDVACTEPVGFFGRMAFSTTLILLIREHGRSFYFPFSSISFFRVLKFSPYKSYTCLVRVITLYISRSYYDRVFTNICLCLFASCAEEG